MMSQSTPILEAKNIRKVFGGLVAVADVSFDILPGEILALIGPNGAGKTTTFNVIAGVYSLDGGEVRFKGERLNGLKCHERARRGLVRTFQNLQIFDNMTVLENVMVGRQTRSRYGFIEAALRLPSARREEREICERALHYLALVDLKSHADRPANSLPFGQQRLLEIARALAAEPELLMLDEPAAGLTRKETEDLDELIRRIRDGGTTILLIEHDMELVMGIADRVVVLDYGQKIADGTVEEVQNDARVIEAYLGEEF